MNATPGIADAGRRLRLIVGGAAPLPGPHFPFPSGRPDEGAPKPFPLGIEPGGPAALELERQELRAAVERLELRVAELEHENRGLRRAAEAARAEGERAERERTVRTMAGRLPSILMGGR